MLALVRLEEMNYQDIQEYIAFSQREYAQGMLDQAEYPDYETALRAARSEVMHYYNKLNPGESHYAYHILNRDGVRVGILAFSILQRKEHKMPFVFVDYITVFPQYRRLGYAKYAMQWLEDWVRAHQLTTIDLNVMQHKKGALRLYQNLGYSIYRERTLGFSKVPSRYDMRKQI